MDRESPSQKAGDGGLCYYPQIDALEALHDYYPDAAFILNIRPAAHWRSVSHWGNMKQRLTQCNISTKPGGRAPDIAWYHSHLAYIRSFVAKHPSHQLLELYIEDPSASQLLHAAFGIETKCWGHKNPSVAKHGGGRGRRR